MPLTDDHGYQPFAAMSGILAGDTDEVVATVLESSDDADASRICAGD